jgi:hypothetical protein
MQAEKQWQSWFTRLSDYEKFYWDELITKVLAAQDDIREWRTELNRIEQRARARERRGA